MQTTVKVKCLDQMLLVNAPRIASGGVNEIRLEITFCPLWEGLAKTAVFYTDPAKTYTVLVTNDTCIVPAEVTDTPGTVYFGFMGVAGETTRTTEMGRLILKQGAPSWAEEPTPDVYHQILAQYAEAQAELDEAQRQLENTQQAWQQSQTEVAEAKAAAENAEAAAKEATDIADKVLFKTGDTMTGGLNMGGHRVAGLGSPQDEEDAVPLGYAQKNFVPHSYYEYKGEGVLSHEVDYVLTEIHKMQNTELRVIHFKFAPGHSFPEAPQHGEVICTLYRGLSSDPEFGVYGFAEMILYSDNYPALHVRRRMFAGDWKEYEWENPPMMEGVEYCTTERFEGEPVYAVKLTKEGLPNAAATWELGAINVGAMGHLISVEGAINHFGDAGDRRPLPAIQSDGSMAFIHCNSHHAYVETTGDFSQYSAEVIVKYVKATN